MTAQHGLAPFEVSIPLPGALAQYADRERAFVAALRGVVVQEEGRPGFPLRVLTSVPLPGVGDRHKVADVP